MSEINNNSIDKSSSDRILEVKDLRISFRTNNGTVKAVRGINFSLYRGRTLGIVGESGSGKSVTSRAILGILAGNKIIDGGQILYDGRDLLKLSEESFTKIRGSKIAMIFQDPMSSLNPLMKVGKQLTEAMVLKRKASKKEAKKKIDLIHSILLKWALKSNYLDKKTINHLFERWTESTYSLTDHINQNDYAVVSQLYTICFNKDYSRDMPLTSADEKLLRECVLEEESNVLSLLEQNPKNKKYQKQMKKLAIDRAKLVRAIVANVIDPKWALTEEEKQSIMQLIEIASKEEFKIAHEYKEKTLDSTKKLLDTYFSDFDSYNPKELKKFLKELLPLIEKAQYYLGEEKDDIALTFVPTIKGYIAEYYASLDLIKKQAKFDKKKARLINKGKYTKDLEIKEKAFSREVVIEPKVIYQKTIDAVKAFIEHMEKVIDKDLYNEKAYSESLFNYVNKLCVEKVHVLSKREIKDRAIELMKEVGIPEAEKRFDQYPFQFSGGMRQRIVIAIALSANPDILICDEPTTALDVTIQSQILELINRLKEEKGLSIIFITHDLGVIANMADDIAVMYAGKIVEYGTVQDIFYDPRHPYTWALLSSMPDLNTKEKLEAIPGTPPNMILPPKGDAFAARNKYAMKIDFEEEPPLFKISDTHYAATWLLHPNAPEVVPPRIVTERIRIAKERSKGE